MARPVRIFFVADIHGSERCFRKFLNAASAYHADALLVGGDVAAKTITPLFPENGGWTGTYLGGRRRVSSTEELNRFEADLRAIGTLPYRVERREWEAFQFDSSQMSALFKRLAVAQLQEWMDLAAQRLASTPVTTFIGLGNDDFDEMEPVIAQHPYVQLTDSRLLRIADHELLTLPYSNPTPWKTAREISEPEIERRIADGARGVEHLDRCIFNFHVPPDGTPLDLAPQLDANLTKLMGLGGEVDLVHVGSRSVRAALERFQPLLGLHGHIHESKGFVRIGRTTCLNPGSAYGEGVLQGAIVDLEAGRVRSYVLTTG